MRPVYQDTRGRYASQGEDRVYADDAADGYDTLEWIAEQPWTNQRVGVSGSSAAATTAPWRRPAPGTRRCGPFSPRSARPVSMTMLCTKGRRSELERLWLWVAKNIPGLSVSHQHAAMRRAGATEARMAAARDSASACYDRLEAAGHDTPPFIECLDWLRLPLTNHPDFAVWQPFLNEILTHPAPDAFRTAHDFRRTITIPGFHATTWYDIFLTSVLAAFQEIQARTGTQKLWIGP